MKQKRKEFFELLNFRSLMRLSLSKDNIKHIWGKRYLKELTTKEKEHLKENNNDIAREKITYLEKHISKLKVFHWVQFIGITGSIAAGFVKKEDDIDVIVIVRNGTMWLYRATVVFRNLFHNKIRAKRHKNIQDKICLNLICEERGILFDKDIFNFHELMFLIPIYQKKYIYRIYSQNNWLRTKYNVKKENLQSKITSKKEANIIIRAFNGVAYILQTVFMQISGHRPDIIRLRRNNDIGRIEFFDSNFKTKILKTYSKEFKSIS